MGAALGLVGLRCGTRRRSPACTARSVTDTGSALLVLSQQLAARSCGSICKERGAELPSFLFVCKYNLRNQGFGSGSFRKAHFVLRHGRVLAVSLRSTVRGDGSILLMKINASCLYQCIKSVPAELPRKAERPSLPIYPSPFVSPTELHTELRPEPCSCAVQACTGSSGSDLQVT